MYIMIPLPTFIVTRGGHVFARHHHHLKLFDWLVAASN